ncbi:hypothetical protein WICANDRAFT_97166, partial [Wickerhamomyces anomalus NRRL Y-366-8]
MCGDFIAVSRMANNNGPTSLAPCPHCVIMKDTIDKNLGDIDLDLNSELEERSTVILDDITEFKKFVNKRGTLKSNGGSVVTRGFYNLQRKDEKFYEAAAKLLNSVPDAEKILGFSNISSLFCHDYAFGLQGGYSLMFDSMHYVENICKKLRKRLCHIYGGFVHLNIINYPNEFGEIPTSFNKSDDKSRLDHTTHCKAEQEMSLVVLLNIMINNDTRAGDQAEIQLPGDFKRIFDLNFLIIHVISSYHVLKSDLSYFDTLIKEFITKYEGDLCNRSQEYWQELQDNINSKYGLRGSKQIELERMTSIYLHTLCHVTELIKFKGPIHNYNSFDLEQLMGVIKKASANATFKTLTNISNKAVFLYNIMEIMSIILQQDVNLSKLEPVQTFEEILDIYKIKAIACETINLKNDQSFKDKLAQLEKRRTDDDD